ncbi:hypothetical protein BBEV_2637 [Salisediminibacterium beveridgei]|uniref:Phosphatidylglycerol lysyltransferase n=2 Tax=Salisediminibacterium beveridgei TaxID=632773 RepID=A0A1D7QY94_9BACI|nr:hypothetical protein BBEV_2637 [Salisediminibacterium beveridgei]
MINPGIVAMLLFIQLLTFVLMSRQWMRLIQVKGHKSFLTVMNILFTSAFTEGITPSVKFGSEAVKGHMFMQRFSLGLKVIMETVAVQKLISISALVPFLLLTVWFWWSPARAGFTVAGLIVLAGLIFAAIRVIQGRSNALGDWSLKKIWFHYRLSFVIWALFYAKGLILSLSMGLELSLLAVLLAAFLPYMAALTPITPGGIGTFEGVMVMVLVAFGVTAGTAIVFALVFRLITFWFGVTVGAGCILWNMYHKNHVNSHEIEAV